jgi:hypothetical protein
MIKHYVEHAIVIAVGFLVGAVFAMIIAPGARLAMIGTGIVSGFSACALFDQYFGGDWLWLFRRPADARKIIR